jgi:phosphoglycerate dehydrogenase-like enzyme
VTSGASGPAREEGPVVAVHGGKVGDAILVGLRGSMPGCAFVPAGEPAAKDGAEVLVTLNDEAAAIEAALTDGIRWVHVLGAGVDGFPLEALAGRTVTCSKGASAAAIAEFVLASMLAFEKRLPETWVDEPPAEWNTAALGSLDGKTLGIVGLGSIGSEVAKRALAFDMVVLGLRRTGGPSPLSGVSLGADLDELLTRSDHLVLAAPATAATAHLVDDETLAEVKPGLHLVNISRGTLVDQEALLRALDDGRVALASLDVVDPEPLPAGHPFYAHPLVHLSPHVSWSSPNTVVRTFEIFADNLSRYRNREPLRGHVDLEAGY